MIPVYELAKNKKEILSRLDDMSTKYMLHMLKIYFHSNSRYYNHWVKEVHAFYSKVNKTKESNKYPKSDEIYEAILGQWEDDLENYTASDVRTINFMYKDDLPKIENYNYESVYKFLKNYTVWLSNELSSKGEVSLDMVYNKIEELLGNRNN